MFIELTDLENKKFSQNIFHIQRVFEHVDKGKPITGAILVTCNNVNQNLAIICQNGYDEINRLIDEKICLYCAVLGESMPRA